VDGVDFLSLIFSRIGEREFRDSGRSLFGDDLEALDHAGHDFMFEPRI
jgi:hypothetical protein